MKKFCEHCKKDRVIYFTQVSVMKYSPVCNTCKSYMRGYVDYSEISNNPNIAVWYLEENLHTVSLVL